MRRWLSILLLVLLPFQFGWAVAAIYCEHESGARAEHFGHHDHEHPQASAGDSSESSEVKLSPVLDVADCHFHCQCAVGLPAVPVMTIALGGHPLPGWTVADVLAPVLSRPERPQWPDHA